MCVCIVDWLVPLQTRRSGCPRTRITDAVIFHADVENLTQVLLTTEPSLQASPGTFNIPPILQRLSTAQNSVKCQTHDMLQNTSFVRQEQGLDLAFQHQFLKLAWLHQPVDWLPDRE